MKNKIINSKWSNNFGQTAENNDVMLGNLNSIRSRTLTVFKRIYLLLFKIQVDA